MIVILSSLSKKSRRSRRIYTRIIALTYISTTLVKCISLRLEPRVIKGIRSYLERLVVVLVVLLVNLGLDIDYS